MKLRGAGYILRHGETFRFLACSLGAMAIEYLSLSAASCLVPMRQAQKIAFLIRAALIARAECGPLSVGAMALTASNIFGLRPKTTILGVR